MNQKVKKQKTFIFTKLYSKKIYYEPNINDSVQFYNNEPKELSPMSPTKNIFVCSNNKFPKGRFKPTVIERTCSDGTVLRNNIYNNTSDKLTKKQIYAKLSKRTKAITR